MRFSLRTHGLFGLGLLVVLAVLYPANGIAVTGAGLPDGFDPMGQSCKLFLIVVDVTAGTQLAEVEVAGSSPTFGQIFPGEDCVYFVATEADKKHGYVTKISLSPDP